MPNKVVSKKAVDQMKETIAYYDTLIANVKSYASGSKDSIKSLMDSVRELEFDAGIKKDAGIRSDDDKGMSVARRFQGMQEAYQTVITMVEKPEDVVANYQQQKDFAQKRLSELEGIEIRDTESD